MIEKSNISEVMKNIQERVGEKVVLRGSLGRNKTFEREGTLLNTYPNLFLVKMDDNNRNYTYTYTEVLTRTVELDVNVDGIFNSILDEMNPKINL